MVIQDNEVIRLLLGLGVMVFAVLGRSRLGRAPAWPLLLAAYSVLLGGWILTVLEGLVWQEVLNMLEHLCYLCSAILMLIWCWRAFSQETSRP